MQLTMLMNELAEQRRAEPDRRPHLGAGPQRPRRGHAGPERDRAVLHPPRRGRQRHDPHRDQPRHEPARPEPRSAEDLAGRPRRRHRRPRSRRSCGWRRRSRSCAAPSTHDLDAVGPRLRRGRQARPLLRRRQPRPSRVRRPRALRRAPRPRTPTSASAARARTSASARTWPGARCRSCSASCSPACPTSRSSAIPVPLEAMGIPLVGGIKRLPVRFTPTAPVGA